MFQGTTLKNLGLRIQLGHGRRGKGRRGQCVLPRQAVDDDFVVVDTHGVHEVGLNFCNCSTAQPHDIQLLRARWYPATGKNPRTAATFRVLRRYHLMVLESKCSGQEFYNSIARETDNTGTQPVRVCPLKRQATIETDTRFRIVMTSFSVWGVNGATYGC